LRPDARDDVPTLVREMFGDRSSDSSACARDEY
jgi:hypothetical protein